MRSSHLLKLTLLCVISLSGFTLIHTWMAATPISGSESAEGGDLAWSSAIQRNAG